MKWRADSPDHEDDCEGYCAQETPDIRDWLEYQRYCAQAKERREIVLEFEDWIASQNKLGMKH
jgi:hypothetical protein